MVGKNDKVEIEGRKYKISEFSDLAKRLLKNLEELDSLKRDKANMIAVLTKAKKAYIADLKREMLSAKSGFNFSD